MRIAALAVIFVLKINGSCQAQAEACQNGRPGRPFVARVHSPVTALNPKSNDTRPDQILQALSQGVCTHHYFYT